MEKKIKLCYYMCIMDKITDKNRLEFAIFCIENIAIKLKKDGSEVYSALAEKSSRLRHN